MWKGNTLSTAYCEALRSHCFLCALTLGLMAPPHSRFSKDTAHAVPTCFTLTFRQVRCTLLCREPAVARALELQCILGSSHYMSFSPPQGKTRKKDTNWWRENAITNAAGWAHVHACGTHTDMTHGSVHINNPANIRSDFILPNISNCCNCVVL